MTKQFLFAAVAASVAAATASADLVCGWTMPTAIPAATTGVSYNYGAANQGTGAAGSMLSSAHAVAATTYSSPAGNGSTYSLSTNNWTIGDNYQVAFSTIGSAGLSISWDQTRSGTGPATFDALLSIDGGATLTNQVGFTQTVALGLAAENLADVRVRFSSTVTTAAAGTNRIDNIMVTNNIPSPGAIALLGLAGLVARRRR